MYVKCINKYYRSSWGSVLSPVLLDSGVKAFSKDSSRVFCSSSVGLSRLKFTDLWGLVQGLYPLVWAFDYRALLVWVIFWWVYLRQWGWGVALLSNLCKIYAFLAFNIYAIHPAVREVRTQKSLTTFFQLKCLFMWARFVFNHGTICPTLH